LLAAEIILYLTRLTVPLKMPLQEKLHKVDTMKKENKEVMKKRSLSRYGESLFLVIIGFFFQVLARPLGSFPVDSSGSEQLGPMAQAIFCLIKFLIREMHDVATMSFNLI